MLFVISLIIVVVAVIINRASRKSGRYQDARFSLIGAGVGAVIAISQIFTVVPAGTVGVVDFLGTVSDNTLKAGVNFVNPAANVIKFSIKTQEIREVMSIPSKEGLEIQLEVSLLYNLDPENASQIYKTVGENFREIILIPQFRSVVRGVTARYDAKALYTASREQLASEMRQELESLVGPRGILIESVPMRQISLPKGLIASIEEKLKAEQESERMEFILRREAQEADRKRIEAKGISDFQNIVARGISQQLLQWKGIEATEKLANSPNSKIVIIGSGKDGLPIILGNQ